LGDDKERVSGAGVVEYVEVEGGCWRIAGDDGVNYEPLGLPEEFKENGLTVWFEGTVREDLSSTCMVGTLLEIKDIHMVTKGD
jgi:hypothetical protein